MALSFDEEGKLEHSKAWFTQAAHLFFDSGSGANSRVGKAFFEYSTLMDAFALVQQARLERLNSEYEESLSEFAKATEVLRSSVHFGFLSGYESGCAMLETALELENLDDSFQAFKNANALFEQSKLALGLRDERHPLVDVIDSLIKYSISEAFLTESRTFLEAGNENEALRKVQQSTVSADDHKSLTRKIGTEPYLINYFPLEDWNRALSTGFVATFPEQDSIWLGNIGSNPVKVETLGGNRIDQIIGPAQSISLPLTKSSKGRIRVVYEDMRNQKWYDEGSMLVI
jgi:hypothetical protein